MKTLKIKELGIEVETKLRKAVKFKDIKVPKGWRLLTFQDCCFIYDNLYEEIPIGKEIEWIEHYSKRMKERGYASALDSDWDDGRLDVGGDGYDDVSGGYAFGVRFCRDLKENKE